MGEWLTNADLWMRAHDGWNSLAILGGFGFLVWWAILTLKHNL